MKRSDKIPWCILLCVVILFELLSYTRRLFTYFGINGDEVLSNIIIYAGIPLFIVVLFSMVLLKKYFPVSNAALFQDKRFFILFVVMALLGIGLFF